MVVATFVSAVLLFMPIPLEPQESAPRVEVKVTQKYLVPVCLNGRPVDAGERLWRLALGSHSLAFTMHNAPRYALAGADVAPGIAVV